MSAQPGPPAVGGEAPLDVPAALTAMASAVRAGAFQEAERLGGLARPPLACTLLPAGSAPAPSSIVLDPGPPLAKGPHSTVFAGVSALDAATSPVAVKRPAIRSAADLAAFRTEVSLLARAGGGRVLRLVGARALPPDYWAAVRRAPGGSLATALDGGTLKRLDQAGGLWASAARLGADVAAALARLHAARIVHRDVKPGNVLLSRGLKRAWLGDLGVAVDLQAAAEDDEGEAADGNVSGAYDAAHPRSRAAAIAATLASSSGSSKPSKPSGGHSRRHVVGTLEFLAPEVLMGGDGAAPAPPADVYALAVTIACVAAGEAVPYRDATRDNPAAHTVLDFGYGRAELAAAVVGAGLRPSIPPGGPPALLALLDAAWGADAAGRPSAEVMEARLRAIVDAEYGGMGESEDEGEPAMVDGGGAGAAAPPPPPPPPPPPSATAWTDPAWWPPPPSPCSFGDTTYAVVDDHGGAPPTAPAAPPPPLLAGLHAQAGARGADRMEDAAVIASPLPSAPGSGPGHLLAVFDGHRGAGTAVFAAEHAVEAVRRRWCGPDAAAHPAAALASAFADLHAGWLEREAAGAAAASAAGRPPPQPSGATAVLALAWRDWLFVAGAGDARAVLVAEDGSALRLTTDHVADDEAERRRVLASVGDANANLHRFDAGGWRLGAAGLAVTRALGDADATASGLTCSPTVTARRLAGGNARDAALILASDGLWDVVTDAEAAGLVRDTVKDPALAAKRLVHEALGRGSGDNVSAAVAFLRAESTCEAVFVERGR